MNYEEQIEIGKRIRKAFETERTVDEAAAHTKIDRAIVARWLETAVALGEVEMVPDGKVQKRWALKYRPKKKVDE